MKDPYIQENGTLKNKLGISDYDELNDAERDITFSKFLNVEQKYKRNFDIEYFKSIHKHIFKDIFDWAGEFRTVPIYKEEIVIPGCSLDYAPAKEIPQRLKECLDTMNNTDWNALPLDKKAEEFTKQLAALWKVHPFRDGNTRTVLTFANQFSKEHGFPLDLGSLLDNLTRKEDENGRITRYSIRDKFVLAALPEKDYPEPEHLTKLIHQSMKTGIQKNIDSLHKTLNGGETTLSYSPASTEDKGDER